MITRKSGTMWDKVWNRSTTLVSLIVIHICLSSCNQYESEFQKFLVRFRKTYWNDTAEYRKRLEVFELNYKIAQYQNLNRTDNTSAWFGITKFSDMTFSEFKAIYLSDYKPSHLPHVSDKGLLMLMNSAAPQHYHELPKRVDWREKGYVTKVKDQGECGGCWAFSSIELLESRYAAETNHLQQFSIQEIIDCSRSVKTPFGNLAGCEGGQLCAALFWLNETQLSVVPESKYKYRDHDEYCRIIPKSSPGIKLKDYKCFNYMNREEEVLRYLATQGPVSVAVDASNWHNYLGGIIQYHCPPHLNHAVQIVGYDLTGPVPYYIVRNSWGKNWGLDGYIHIKYGENMCGIASEVTMVTGIDVS